MLEDEGKTAKILDFPIWLGMELTCPVCEKTIVLDGKNLAKVGECAAAKSKHFVTCDRCGTDVHF